MVIFSRNDFKQKFHVEIDFLSYAGLLDAIPRKWKTEMRSHSPNIIQTPNVNRFVPKVGGKLLDKVTTKEVYDLLLHSVFQAPTVLGKWDSFFDCSQ